MSPDSERTFGLSAWSKFILWFILVFVSGSVGLVVFLVHEYVRSWSHIDSRALFGLPILLLGWMGALQIRYLLAGGPLLRINARGIEEHLSGFGFIPWDDIIGVVARVTFVRGGVYRTLYLRVRKSNEYFGRVSLLVRPTLPLKWFRRDSLPISFSYLDGSMDDALESIRAWRPEIPVDEASN